VHIFLIFIIDKNLANHSKFSKEIQFIILHIFFSCPTDLFCIQFMQNYNLLIENLELIFTYIKYWF